MDIKHYINYFDEIAQLEKHQQFSILEQALKSAQQQLKLGKFLTAVALTPWLFILLIGGTIYAVWGYSVWLPLIAILAGLVLSRMVISKTHEVVLHKGLIQVLNTSAGNHHDKAE